MTKPSLSSLEIMALGNRIEFLILQSRTSPPEARAHYEQQIKPLAEEYLRLAGYHYKYIEQPVVAGERR